MAPTVVDKFASKRIVLPLNLSVTSPFFKICKHTGLTRGTNFGCPEGQIAATFTHNKMADSNNGKCANVNVLKMCLGGGMIETTMLPQCNPFRVSVCKGCMPAGGTNIFELKESRAAASHIVFWVYPLVSLKLKPTKQRQHSHMHLVTRRLSLRAVGVSCVMGS